MWRRAKVMFLGNGRAGKTSLLRVLAGLPFDPAEESSRCATSPNFAKRLQPSGLQRLRSDAVKLSVWDFPGQLEYSAAHEYFVSSRQAVVVDDDAYLDKLLHQQRQV